MRIWLMILSLFLAFVTTFHSHAKAPTEGSCYIVEYDDSGYGHETTVYSNSRIIVLGLKFGAQIIDLKNGSLKLSLGGTPESEEVIFDRNKSGYLSKFESTYYSCTITPPLS